MHTPTRADHSANVIPLGAAKSRVASELLISTVLQLISRHGTLAATNAAAAPKRKTDVDAHAAADATANSAAAIERHLKALANLPNMEPILRATCQQLSEQWGMMYEQQLPKPAPAAFITRLISGSRPQRQV